MKEFLGHRSSWLVRHEDGSTTLAMSEGIEVTDEMVERAARALCAGGVKALDGTMATWERHADGFRSMAREALAAAFQETRREESA